jgi:hypothetical protein
VARAVLVASRFPGQPSQLAARCALLNRALAGDNIEPHRPSFVRRNGVSAALLNPSGGTRMQGASIAIGTLLDADDDDWHVPGAALPDGSFALLRADEDEVELAADNAGSRTIWYALTDDELIASSSQRAIVNLLGSFEPNRNVLPWMLSSGTLGPTDGWDARLKRVQAGERVVLDRAHWRVRSTKEAPAFIPDRSLSRAAHLERLKAAVADACDRWSFDAEKWVLTLSGGADSRSLLYLLRDRGIDTVTWGLPESGEQDGSDAQIARQVARALAAPHRFFTIEPHGREPELVLERFLAAGEGRVDRISGYVDGFDVWKTLFDDGYGGVIRGDEAFGWVPVQSAYAVRAATNLATLADYFSPQELATFELAEQPLPEDFTRASGETLATWRDRLYQQARIPTFLAALTDLKTAYLEIGNPLLARSVLECVRAMPDELRTDKPLWREIVGAQLPDVALAKRVAIPTVTDFLNDRRVLQLLQDELASEHAAALLAPALRARCCAALQAAARAAGRTTRRGDWRHSALAAVIPKPVRAIVRNWRANQPSINPLVLAFRAFIAARMHEMLRADAALPRSERAPEFDVEGARRDGTT